MRIVRFVDHDDETHHGEEHPDGTATPLLDPQGVLGPRTAAHRRDLLRGKRAVVADDDRNMRELMATTLSKVGCRCTTCVDGTEAMAAVRTDGIDLVVSDIVMPGHTGYEIFTAARERHADLPIVLVTGFGYDPSHSVVRASEEGLTAVLYKPFTPRQLVEEIDRAIRVATARLADTLMPIGAPRAIKRRLPPVVPTDIVCIGRNYPIAARPGTTPSDAVGGPDQLEVFIKPTTAIAGPEDPIRLPGFGGLDPLVDAEGELAVLIGAQTHEIAASDVGDVIVGLTAANDVTARHWQTATGSPKWMRGKGFDTFCPLGPAIVTGSPEELTTPREIRTIVNGHVIRRGSTADMICSVPDIVSQLSQHMTLEAGTVILTGAPPLVAGDRPAALTPGDEVVVDVEGVGRLVNHVLGP
ncbi:MAG: response regulator [Phycisphaerales bacterium]|nr:response regulator [Phycisphaerales bacterium]